MQTLTDDSGQVWEVVFAVSDAEAWNAINHARVTGSVGSNHYESGPDGIERPVAIVRRVISPA